MPAGSSLKNRTHGLCSTYNAGCRCEPCSAAQRAYQRKYRRENRERLLQRGRQRYREEGRAQHRERTYGLTDREYRALLAKQGGACAICRRSPEEAGIRVLHVDHDHGTGAVRGLLCHTCNAALGLFGDGVERVERAVVYLRSAT